MLVSRLQWFTPQLPNKFKKKHQENYVDPMAAVPKKTPEIQQPKIQTKVSTLNKSKIQTHYILLVHLVHRQVERLEQPL